MVDTVTLDAATAPSAPDDNSNGTPVNITGGEGGSVNGSGGGIFIQGGPAPGSGGVGGFVQVRGGGNPNGQNGTGGAANLIAGDGDTPGDATISAGTSIHDGGSVYLFAGISLTDGDGGNVQINSGRGNNTNGSAGDIQLYGADAHAGSNGNGGNIRIEPGAKNGTGVPGLIKVVVPTEDPLVPRALWNNGGVLTVSAG